MEISESKVRAIVERVVARLAVDEAAIQAVAAPTREIGIFDDLESAVRAARKAYEGLRELSLAHRQELIDRIREALRPHVETMARMAVEETSFGRVDDKIIKNRLAINKTPGTEDLTTRAVTGDNGLTLWEYAPWGVIGAITPCTNPTETIICNGIGFIAAGNSAVFCPHPAAKRVSVYCVQIINEAVVAAGGPPNLLCTLRAPSIEQAQNLMKHPGINMLVVTGGPAVVQAAMASGKRVVGAGPGNPPAVVDESADLAKAGRDIVLGCSFDNNVVCTDEKEVIVVNKVADQLKAHMLENGAVEVKSYHLKQLEKLLLKSMPGPRREGDVNKEWVGKDATKILQAIGVDAPASTRLVLCDVDEDHPFVWTELLTPVLAFVRVRDVDAGIQLAHEAEHGYRHTASMHSNNLEKLSKMARLLDTSIFVKNGSNFAGLGAGGEGHTSFTIASPTGDGVTSARTFTRERKCVLVDRFRIL